MTTSLALAAIEDNWLNSFFTSFDYSPNNFGAKTDTFAHLDLILANANRFNFYYTTVPSSGLGYVDSSSTPPVTPAKCDGNPPMRIDPTATPFKSRVMTRFSCFTHRFSVIVLLDQIG